MIVGFLFQTAGYFTFCLWMNVLNPACCWGVGTWWSLRPLPIQAILCFFSFAFGSTIKTKPFSFFLMYLSWLLKCSSHMYDLLPPHSAPSVFQKDACLEDRRHAASLSGCCNHLWEGGGRSRCDQSMENALSLFICLLKGWDALENYQGMWNHWIV